VEAVLVGAAAVAVIAAALLLLAMNAWTVPS
jgi:hypothetical protein